MPTKQKQQVQEPLYFFFSEMLLDIFLWLTYRNQDLFFNNADLANNFKHSTGSQRPIEPPGTTANFRIHGRTRAVLTARGRETDELNLELADAEW